MIAFSLYFLELIIALIFLILAADRFVVGAVIIVKYFKVNSLIIGLTVVALGTSAPEIFVSIFAAVKGHAEIAIGNVIGSNITNIGLVLGATALVGVVSVRKSLLIREIPVLLIITIIAVALLWDFKLNLINGVILLSIYFITMGGFIWYGIYKKQEANINHVEEKININIKKGILWFLLGSILMPISSNFLVNSASEIARYLGVSELIIGLTIVAIGTSLPELVTSVISTAKGEHDIALGNVIGSNIANLTIVLGPVGIINPSVLPNSVHFDLYFMSGLTILMAVMAFWRKDINRVEGGVLFLSFVLYILMLIKC